MLNRNTVPCEETAATSTPGAMPEIFQLIEVLDRRLKQFQVDTLREARLTIPQYYILSLLSACDGQPLKDLAETLACSRATVTGIVDTLEKKRLVARGPNPQDRRSLLVHLTGAGRDLLQSTPGLERTFGGCCCDLLPPDQTDQLRYLLRQLSAALPF